MNVVTVVGPESHVPNLLIMAWMRADASKYPV